ncbi:MAG: phosphatidate cytidylyltransferase [Panacibacter sp.]
MKKRSFYSLLFVVALIAMVLTGCAVVTGIFKAGVWVGVLIVVAVIAALIFFLKGRKN